MDMLDSDRAWLQDQLQFGWSLPRKAHWLLRRPIIRHVRALVLSWRIETRSAFWRSIGATYSGYDAWVVYAIARGWC